MNNTEETNREYNLNLYLNYILDNYYGVYDELMEKFDGMPGFIRRESND